MDLCLTIEHRFKMMPDGTVYTKVAFQYDFWKRYLVVFDNVKVIARVERVVELSDDWVVSSGDRVSFVVLPYYVGPKGYIQNYVEIRRILKRAIKKSDAIILRVPSQIASLVVSLLNKRKQLFGLEVVGDPNLSMARGAIVHPLRRFFHFYFKRKLKEQCKKAIATAYVTESTLQKIYPPRKETFTTHYSSILLNQEDLALKPKSYYNKVEPLNIICIGSMANLGKGQDDLIESIRICFVRGVNFHLFLMGDGVHKSYYEDLVKKLKIAERVTFLGRVKSGEPVKDWLDKSDILVLPSRGEGLPRVIIEAMARGMVAIGTDVSGIPELLEKQFLVPINNPEALANKLIEVTSDVNLMNKAAKANLERSRKYLNDRISKRRIEFYREVEKKTLEYIGKKTL